MPELPKVKLDPSNRSSDLGEAMDKVNLHIEFCRNWLSLDVFPLWFEKGLDRVRGGFIENLNFDGQIPEMPRRAMVQSRQIYSFVTGHRLKVISPEKMNFAVQLGTDYLLKYFSLPSGGFAHSIESSGKLIGPYPDLYTQAFALFALAQSYSVKPDANLKERALQLVQYLYRERAHKGGFTELDSMLAISYKSNPHMHMLEGALAWIQVDRQEKTWLKLAKDLVTLCETKFVDPETGVLAEYFSSDWKPLAENSVFIYEPGHQYEWAWLLSVHDELTGYDSKSLRHQLFKLAEKHGTSRTRKIVYDEMWSHHTPKTRTSRFWPQGERIKAAARLGTEVSAAEKSTYAAAADEALETLFKFLQTPVPGFWYDRLSESDQLSGDFSKSSSLYHIINAMEEYILHRPKLR